MHEYRAVRNPNLPRFTGGAVGYLSYDAVKFFEDIPQANEDDLALPELYFVLTSSMVVFDHVRHRILVVANAYCDGRTLEQVYEEACATIEELEKTISRPLPFRPVEPLDTAALAALDHRQPPSNFTPEEFTDVVDRCKEYIRAGDIIQVVPSQRFEFDTPAPPLSVYRALRCVNPSPYMFLLNFRDMALVGSSPEVMVRVEEQDIELRPIAGTRRRGLSPEEDKLMEEELLADRKELAEHTMLVDLGRNDVGRVSEFNSVHVPELMIIERYSHVMHIVSDVCGTLLPGKDAFDVLAATFPAGTVSGAPKIRAMEIIEEMEKTRRGPYAGTVCYLGYDSNLDSCITIRTIVMKDGKAYIQAGAGIVADSQPELEYKETVNKARAMIKAIKLAEQIN
jgi:anthranilate synthase component 1